MMHILTLLLATYFVRPSIQDPKNPLTDFCRRFAHQTAVIGRRLFVNGGYVDWNPISQNPFNYTNTWFLYNDLDVLNDGLPQLYSNLSINATVPAVSGGMLWADTINEVLYQFAGEFQGPPQPATLWTYDAVYNIWNQSNVPDEINRVSWGAGVAVDQRAEGYYLGGWLGNLTMTGWDGPAIATSNMIIYDMIGQTFSNNTGPDSTGRAEGVMVFLPASDNGLLIYFGGVLDPFRNGTMVGSAMSTIYVYDINSEKWYTQSASGDIPDMRRRFCAGATWAPDQTSYNIYLYGGLGVPPNNSTGFDDVYILTLPSFTWIKWWPTQPSNSSRPHHSLTCNVIDGTQMLIIGGTFPGDDDCDSPNVYGTHNLNLGADGPDSSMWDLFYSNITTYQVPPQIIARIGGGPSGAANVVRPQSGFDNPDLEVYFTRIPRFTSRTATRFIPTATGNNSLKSSGLTGEERTGAIVGSVVGACVIIIVFIALVLCLLSRQKRGKRTGTTRRPAELPATANPSTASDTMIEEQKSHLCSENQQIPLGNLPSPGSNGSADNTSPAVSSQGISPQGNELPVGTTFVAPVPFSHQSSRPEFSPTPTSQHLQGVYPLGPYYPTQDVDASAGAQQPQIQHHYPQYAPPKSILRGQPHNPVLPEPVTGFPIYRSEFSEADEDKRRSMTKTPAEMYPPPLVILSPQERRDKLEHTTAPNIGVARSTRPVQGGRFVEGE